MRKISAAADWLLRAPVLWGSLLSLAFYAALRNGRLDWFGETTLHRYFDAHIVEWVSTQLFCVGLAAVGIRLVSLIGQFSALGADLIGPPPAGGQPVSDAPDLLRRLDGANPAYKNSLLSQRLRAGLEYVRDTDSADSLEEHLRRLEDVDLEKTSAGYGLPRLVRATLPIVGMLGTVIGITLAIGQLSPDQLEQSLNSVMSALSVAFDTTAQAMSLMLVLWFVMFFAERIEQRLLAGVDRVASQALVGRFQQFGAATDPNVASVRRMSEQVVTAVEQLAAKQAQVWEAAIDASHDHWSKTALATGEALTESLRDAVGEHVSDQANVLTESTKQFSRGIRDGLGTMAELLVESLQQHGRTLTEAEERLATENRKHLSEVEAALGEAMVVSADRQEKAIRQSERMLNEVRDSLVGLTHSAEEQHRAAQERNAAVLDDLREALTSVAGAAEAQHRGVLERSERLVTEVREALSASADAAAEHQRQLVKQSEVLLRVVESTGEVQRLEDTLNKNLTTLGQSHHFEETLLSLSAAVQLLTARVGREGGVTPGSRAA